MYVYVPARDGDIQFVVGHYEPNGRWITESDHETRESAAERVRYLNGGN
jgi:hypothetical protein